MVALSPSVYTFHTPDGNCMRVGNILLSTTTSLLLRLTRSMSMLPPLTPPLTVYSVASFPPPSKFESTQEKQSLTFPASLTATVVKVLGKSHGLNQPKMKNVITTPSDPTLRTFITQHEDRALVEPLLASLRSQSSPDTPITITTTPVTCTYASLTLFQVLTKLLPTTSIDDSIIVPTAFETIGHIAHLNLRENHLPFKVSERKRVSLFGRRAYSRGSARYGYRWHIHKAKLTLPIRLARSFRSSFVKNAPRFARRST